MNEGGSRFGVSFSKGSLRGEPEGSSILMGTPNGMLSKALEMGVCFNRSPAFEDREDTLLS